MGRPRHTYHGNIVVVLIYGVWRKGIYFHSVLLSIYSLLTETIFRVYQRMDKGYFVVYVRSAKSVFYSCMKCMRPAALGRILLGSWVIVGYSREEKTMRYIAQLRRCRALRVELCYAMIWLRCRLLSACSSFSISSSSDCEPRKMRR